MNISFIQYTLVSNISSSISCVISLVKAELARVEGKFTKAQELYEESIEGARIVGRLSVQGYIDLLFKLLFTV